MRILLATTIKALRSEQFDLTTLENQLLSRGFSVDVLTLPFAIKRSTLVAQATSFRLLDVRNSADWLLSLSAPTHLLQHPNKIVVVADDLGRLEDCLQKKYLEDKNVLYLAERQLLYRAESVALAEARVKLCFSETCEDTLRQDELSGFQVVDPSQLGEGILDAIAPASEMMARPERLSA